MAWKERAATEHTGIHLNMIKNMYKKPTANIIFNGEYLKTFLLRSGTEQRCLLSPWLFNILFPYPIYYEIPSQINQAGKNYTGIQIGNKEVKFVSVKETDTKRILFTNPKCELIDIHASMSLHFLPIVKCSVEKKTTSGIY